MSALSNDILGTGAMLARLVQLGARCGLTAETTLQHVLDGAPLPASSAPPASIGDIVDRLRDADLAEPAETGPRPDVQAAGGLLTLEEALLPPEKREKIANLYGATALRNGPIADLARSTPGSVSFFLNEFRKAGDPRIVRGDRLRGINLGAVASNEAPMAVDGVGEDYATAFPSQSDNILPAGSNGEGGRADPVPDVSPEGAHEGRGFESRRDGSGAPEPARSAAVAQAGEVAPPPQVSPFIGIDFGRENPPRPMVFVQDEVHTDLGGLGDQASERPRSQVQILPGLSVAFEGAPVAQSGRAGHDGDPGSNPGEAAEPARSSMERAPSDSPGGAEDNFDESLCFEFPEAGPGFDQDLLDELNAQSFARELGLSSLDGDEECAERDAGSSDLGEDVAAFPAPPTVQEDGPEKGIASPQQPQLDAAAAADTAARPAGPGPELPEADHVADVGNMVAASGDEVVGGNPGPAAPHHAERPGDEGIDSESTLTGGESAAEEAGALPQDSPASSTNSPAEPALPDDIAAAVLTLFRDTTASTGEIAQRAGATNRQAGAIIASGRRRKDPRVVAGDRARGKALAAKPLAPPANPPAPSDEETVTARILRLWRDTLKPATAIAAEVGWPQNKVSATLSTKRKRGNPFILAGDAARTAANAQRAEEPRHPAPKDDGVPGDLYVLAADQVLAIDRGWIVGPHDTRKGFPLINSVLAMLSSGQPIEAEEIARECGVRAGGAVLKQLEHWKDDLAAIGVDVVRVGGSVVQLRRSA